MQERDDKRGKNLHERPMVQVSGRQTLAGSGSGLQGWVGFQTAGEKAGKEAST